MGPRHQVNPAIAAATPDTELAQIAGFQDIGVHVLVDTVARLGTLIANHQAVAASWRAAGFAERGGYHHIAQPRLDRCTHRHEVRCLASLESVGTIAPGSEWRVFLPVRIRTSREADVDQLQG